MIFSRCTPEACILNPSCRTDQSSRVTGPGKEKKVRGRQGGKEKNSNRWNVFESAAGKRSVRHLVPCDSSALFRNSTGSVFGRRKTEDGRLMQHVDDDHGPGTASGINIGP